MKKTASRPFVSAMSVRMLRSKGLALQLSAESYRQRGYVHPMGDGWRGIHDLSPESPSRDRLIRLFDEVDADAILAGVPHGTPKEVARDIAALHEAGLRTVSILDYSGMAGRDFAARSPDKVRETEDEVVRLIGAAP